MLISQFSKATGLSPDTIRFYVTKGLLRPDRSAKGGSNPYQLFGPSEVTAARMIRLQQSLGYYLREIAALNEEYRTGAGSRERTVEILREQIARLEERRTAINSALAFLKGKLAWVETDQSGDAPELADYIC
jgi:MerR family transcriptional regulator, copper efflux regulator